MNDFDLFNFCKRLWKNRFFTTINVIIFTIFGLLYIVITPHQYSVSCVILPQTKQNSYYGNIGNIASIAGINLNSINSNSIGPSLYPKFLNNYDFLKELIHSNYNTSLGSEQLSLLNYFEKNKKFSIFEFLLDNTLGVIKRVFNNVNSSEGGIITNNFELNHFNEDEFKIANIIKEKLKINYDNKDGFITVSAIMPDPILAADFTKKSVFLLQKFVTNDKIAKAKDNLIFIESQLEVAKKNYIEKQIELAKFRDSNKIISSSLRRTSEENLISEYNLYFSIFSELSKQLEEAKIKVKEDTPIFSIINPVVVPTQKSSPKGVVILFLSIFIAIIFSVIVIFSKDLINQFFSSNKLISTYNRVIK